MFDYVLHFAYDWIQAYQEAEDYQDVELLIIIKKRIYPRKEKYTIPITPFNKVLLNLFQLTIGRNGKISSFIKEKLRDYVIIEAPSSRFFIKEELR